MLIKAVINSIDSIFYVGSVVLKAKIVNTFISLHFMVFFKLI